jgi:hypothetical protein
MRKALFTLLAATVSSTVAVHAIPPDQLVSIGSTAKVTGAGSSTAFLCDSKATEDKWMEYITDGDTGAQRELLSQGHLFPVADGAKVKIIEVDVSRHIFKVRVFGSTQEGWIINECLTDVVAPKH